MRACACARARACVTERPLARPPPPRRPQAPDSAGGLQHSIAAFLAASPHGVLVVSHLEKMSLEAMAVMNNVLAEGGGLQHAGRAVPAGRALCVVLVRLGGQGCGEELEGNVKKRLHKAVAEKEGVEMKLSGLGRALRRRLDYVALSAAAAAPPAPEPAGAAEEPKAE